jgi:type I restriction enzyme S subunit
MTRKVKLKDVCREITVGHVGPMAEKYVEDGIPFLRSQNVTPFRVDKSNLKFIDDKFHNMLRKSALRPGDVVVVRTGYPGTACVIPDDLPIANCADLVIFRPSDEIDGYFLSCLFNSVWGKGHVAGNLVGVAQQHFNVGAAKDMEVKLPPIEVQRRAASMLSTYDDLIENNTRRIKVLEQMAQMLYREWFVNFRFPGHKKVKRVESSDGPIPEKWQVATIGQLLKFQIGGGWGEDSKSDAFPLEAYVIRGTDIPAVRLGSLDNCPLRFHKESNLASRRLEPWDIVFEVSGGSKGQPVGRALLVHPSVLAAFGADVICASFCKLLRPDPSRLGSMYFYQFLLDAYTNGLIEKYQVQSTGITNFKFGVFLSDAKVVVAPASTRAEFERMCQPLIDGIAILGRKNSNLRKTRDLLLPKLVSGEISVEHLEPEAVAQTV